MSERGVIEAMPDHAQTAAENAFHFEAKKHGLRQVQEGDWTITFTVAPGDIPYGLLTAPMGTRFMLAACEKNDDETPVVQSEEAKAKPEPDSEVDPVEQPEADASAAGARERKPLSRAQRAGIDCKDEFFQTYLKRTWPDVWKDCEDEDEWSQLSHAELAAEVVRWLCTVKSLADLNTDEQAGICWDRIRAAFLVWKEAA